MHAEPLALLPEAYHPIGLEYRNRWIFRPCVDTQKFVSNLAPEYNIIRTVELGEPQESPQQFSRTLHSQTPLRSLSSRMSCLDEFVRAVNAAKAADIRSY